MGFYDNLMKNLAVVVLLPCLCLAADTPSPDGIVAMTRAVPGEFAADALLRVAALDSVDRTRKVQWIEQAFQRAVEAQEPLKRQPAITRLPGDSGVMARAFQQDLDALSLQLRAVTALEALDKEKARALFRKIPAPQVPKLTCADFMVYDVAPYYDALARLAPVSLAAERVGAITSPVQVIPAAQAVLAAKSDAAFQSELKAFATALGRISGDNRSFAFVGDVGPQILALKEASERRKVSPLPLLENYRQYLVSNEQGAQCADNETMGVANRQVGTPTPEGGVLGEGAEFFNAKLRIAPIAPIQEQDTTPAKVEGVAEGLQGCRGPECDAIGKQYRALIFDSGNGRPYPPAQKQAQFWQKQCRDFLASVAAWQKGTTLSEIQFYRQKSVLYTQMLGLVPAGALQEEIVAALLDLAEKNGSRTEDRIEWFLPLNALIGRTALDPAGIGKHAGPLWESKDPILALYTQLEMAAPRTPDKIMALM